MLKIEANLSKINFRRYAYNHFGKPLRKESIHGEPDKFLGITSIVCYSVITQYFFLLIILGIAYEC